MAVHYQSHNAALYVGDCASVMSSLPDESVDGIVTSPPYAMQRKSTYGGIPEKDYPAWTVAWMNEARRVLKPDGSVIINISPHVKDGQLADYTLRTRLALRDDGWNEAAELIWYKPSAPPMGSPKRPRRSWESLHWFSKHGRPWADARANGTPMGREALREPGNIARNGQAHRNGWGHAPRGGGSFGAVARSRDVYTSRTFRGTEWERQNIAHPAIFPWQLAEWCGKLIIPDGGTILDPFSGSASTGVAAIRNGWNYIGIDSSEEYVSMSARRLEAAQLDGKEAPHPNGDHENPIA